MSIDFYAFYEFRGGLTILSREETKKPRCNVAKSFIGAC